MITLLEEISNILSEKNEKIEILVWEVKKLKEENEALKREEKK